ncbi:hypothetical protein [Lactiplantibacillus plantarum]|uniref:hypothetical protein n=1 Tax=Lactiplantibacillus plantarum TaxID=1590 RepID=UPI000CCF1DE2|nr:hypothetical protein [Lactiplantibacillus plantarum]MDO8182066.1 hypothetical protein [Lactiplantibacillus plantarum]PNW62958.1 hypothetical protein ACZ99_10110 [Lactobacillus sp. ATCC 15578]RHX76678.1 hypothetical protein D2U09_03355 [Lactiplantibacillus plantarum]TXJ95567.1 hypothetical protein FU657_06930 [Lactiplantibacillus plantarum]
MNNVKLRLIKLRVPFLYVSSSKTFDFSRIKEDIKPISLKKDTTVLNIKFHIDSETNQLRVRAVSCFSLDQVIIATKVIALVGKMDKQQWSEDDIKKHNQEIIQPVTAKIKQLISINAEQLTGVPISVEFNGEAN